MLIKNHSHCSHLFNRDLYEKKKKSTCYAAIVNKLSHDFNGIQIVRFKLIYCISLGLTIN